MKPQQSIKTQIIDGCEKLKEALTREDNLECPDCEYNLRSLYNNTLCELLSTFRKELTK